MAMIPDRLCVSESLAVLIDRWIVEYLKGPDPHGLHDVVRRCRALPINLDIGGATLLRPDGELLSLGWGEAPGVETDPVLRTGALVVGARKHPELAQLLPNRPEGALTCEACGGTGEIHVGGRTIGALCGKCGALGWRNAES